MNRNQKRIYHREHQSSFNYALASSGHRENLIN